MLTGMLQHEMSAVILLCKLQRLGVLSPCVHCKLPDLTCCFLSGAAGSQAEMDPASDSHSKQLTDEQVVQQLPEELRRQSLSGSLPVSLQALRVCPALCPSSVMTHSLFIFVLVIVFSFFLIF